MSAIDAGWLVGTGVELVASPRAKLSLELRYQRGVHDLFPAQANTVTQQSVSCLVGIVYGSTPSPRAGRMGPAEERPLRAGIAALDAIEARVTRLIAAMERTSPASPGGRPGTSSCDPRAELPAASGLLATPAECVRAEEQQGAHDALRTVLLALARDLAALVARLERLARGAQDGTSPWDTISRPLLEPVVPHVQWRPWTQPGRGSSAQMPGETTHWCGSRRGATTKQRCWGRRSSRCG